jgi:hypothetical protein
LKFKRSRMKGIERCWGFNWMGDAFDGGSEGEFLDTRFTFGEEIFSFSGLFFIAL